jgi:hypothetical protein
LGSVFVAVLLAPVVPDVAVELFGADSPSWRNPAWRAAALLLVVAVCIGVYVVRRWLARRREADAPMPELRHYPVLVQPLSLRRYEYRPRTSERTGDLMIPEVNVDAAKPKLVVAVATPQIPLDKLEALRTGLKEDGINFTHVSISDPDDVREVVPEVVQKVLALLREREVAPHDVCFDTTGGNVPMSLAMLRAAGLYGSECCYVSSQQDQYGRAPRFQVSRSFEPNALLGAAQ